MLAAHGEREGTALESYKRVAEESSARDAVRYVVRLILDDEEQHHRVFAEMANEIKSFVWEVPVEPTVPAMVPRSDPALLAETRRLLAFETEDAKQLRQLRKALRRSPKSSLHPLLVDLMLHAAQAHRHPQAHPQPTAETVIPQGRRPSLLTLGLQQTGC